MKVLEVQSYLLGGKTIQDIKNDFNIEAVFDEELPIVLLNYTNFSPLHLPIVQETRGLILEKDTWRVVCKSLQAFFYYGEPIASKFQNSINWNNARAYIKYDGALMFVYYYKGAWHIGCRIHPTANILAGSPTFSDYKRTFADVFKDILLENHGMTWDQFTSKLTQGNSYSFEVFDKDLRVGILYDKPYIKLLCVINSQQEEIPIDDIDIGILKPEFKEINKIEDVFNYLNELEDKHEGIVLCDSKFTRLKFRTMSYDTFVIPDMKQKVFSMQSANANNTEALDFLSLYAPDFFMMGNGSPSTDTDTGGTHTQTSATEFNGFSVGEPRIVMMSEKPIISIVSLMSEMNDFYKENKELSDDAYDYAASNTPWQSAAIAMRKGKSMLEYIDTASPNEIYEAVKKYQEIVSKRGNL
jgi:hypothetical protein